MRICEQPDRSFSLPGYTTVFTAELVAIHSFVFFYASNCLNNVIFTDSLAGFLH